MIESNNVRREHYRHQGYVVVRNGIPAEVISHYRALLDGMIQSLKENERPEHLVEPHVRADCWKEWLELCRLPVILDEVQSALGASELILLMTHLIVKPANDGKAVCWHQDNTYWPSVTGTDISTVWLALDDVTLENGCMQVIPRSHAAYEAHEMHATDGDDLLKVTIEMSPEMIAQAIPVELKAGEFSLHDSFIIHGSEPNRSPRRRAGYTMRYADAKSVRVDVPNHGKPVYYVRGDGSYCNAGYRDIRPGQPLPDNPGMHRSRHFPTMTENPTS